MEYPTILLPQPSFKRIEAYLEMGWICRTTTLFPTDLSDLIPEQVFYQKWEELYDYSTNLLGHFELDHNFISLCGEDKKYFQTYWDFAEEVRKPTLENDFVIEQSKQIFFLPIGLIHQKIRIPFKRPPKNNPDELIAIVVHTPTRSNFWHFSIQWVDTQQTIVKPSDSRWKEERIATMRAILTEMITWEAPECAPIDTSYYC